MTADAPENVVADDVPITCNAVEALFVPIPIFPEDPITIGVTPLVESWMKNELGTNGEDEFSTPYTHVLPPYMANVVASEEFVF